MSILKKAPAIKTREIHLEEPLNELLEESPPGFVPEMTGCVSGESPRMKLQCVKSDW